MKIGFVGLGSLGNSLASHLVKAGYDVYVYDLDQSKAEDLLQLGVIWGKTPAQMGEEVDVFITCLPTSKAVNTVLTGEQGAFNTLSSGSIWIEMTTNSNKEIARLNEIAMQKGIDVLDAPLTGGAHRAPTGNMRIFVGGEEKRFHYLKPVFEAMGSKVIYVGKLGDATKMKLITNMLVFINLISLGEGLMLAKRSDIDLKIAYDAIRISSGHSFVHEIESQVILNGSYTALFDINLTLKDIEYTLELAKESGVPAKVTEFCEQTFKKAKEHYGGSSEYAMDVKLLEDELGESLRADGFPERIIDTERIVTG